jgi:type I restriction enzyme R subunit
MRELELEKKLLDKLQSIGYKKIQIKNDKDLKENLKNKIYELNKDELKTPITDKEFPQIYNYLMSGNIIEKAKKLRDNYNLEREDGSKVYIKFFKSSMNNQEEWCKNIFEVANQIPIKNNRYDVIILINGLPLVQIELKSKTELKRAFEQIKRYKLESYANTLFEYI